MDTTTLHKAGRIIVGAGIAAVMALSNSGAQAATITPSGVNGAQHFIDCFGAMFNDPAMHAMACAPGFDGPKDTLASPGGTTVRPCEDALPSIDLMSMRLEKGERIEVACGGGPIVLEDALF
jgi:hypothetical protein